jgi:two-component system, OmpR family, response regulator TctD
MDHVTERAPRILVVDSDTEIANMLKIYLEGLGALVDIASGGEDARVLLSTQEYDLVSLEVDLPDSDGFVLVMYIKAMDRALPVLILTKEDERIARLHGLELGADDYMTKPFDIEEYWLRVRNAIRRNAYLKSSLNSG